ncbi:cytochrome P450 [Ganoderma leucocontextum]|nr:cytochrome P450 [Ganoderma leucocontextum]
MDDIPWMAVCLACFVSMVFFHWYTNPLHSIPTLGGSSLPGLSILTTLYFVRHSKPLLDEGYMKYRNSAFKIPLLDKWVVVICGSKMIEDVRKRPDDELSTYAGIREFSQTAYTAGPEMLADTGHESSTIIKENLTRGIPGFAPTVAEEVQCTLQEYISSGDGDWAAVNAWDLMRNVITRSTSRIFVGLPLCRDEQYLSIVHKHLTDFMKTIITMNMIPTFLKPIFGPKVSQVPENVAMGLSVLGPVIEERNRAMEEYGGDWSGKPNDMLQWIMDRSVPRGKSNEYILERLLGSNFAAINTATNTLTHVLYHLAALPESHETLRDEIEPLVSSEGWTATAISKMVKLDSFMKESQRYTGIGLTSLMKKAMKDVRLNDGTFIPKGTVLVAAYGPMHHDEKHYPNPEVFDPFRFSRMREQDGDGVKHQYTTASATYLPWGYGPHACPGRFFAVMEMKVILANMIVHYDLKLGGDGRRPKNTCMGFSIHAARDGVVLLRKRRSSWLSQAL